MVDCNELRTQSLLLDKRRTPPTQTKDLRRYDEARSALLTFNRATDKQAIALGIGNKNSKGRNDWQNNQRYQSGGPYYILLIVLSCMCKRYARVRPHSSVLPRSRRNEVTPPLFSYFCCYELLQHLYYFILYFMYGFCPPPALLAVWCTRKQRGGSKKKKACLRIFFLFLFSCLHLVPHLGLIARSTY